MTPALSSTFATDARCAAPWSVKSAGSSTGLTETDGPRTETRKRRCSKGERFTRKLGDQIAPHIGTCEWRLDLTLEKQWASATLEGLQLHIDLYLPARVDAAKIQAVIEQIDFPLPRMFIGDIDAKLSPHGFGIDVLLLNDT